MPRAIWKGAISFGLVYVPVALYPASESIDIDFDWLDKRSMDPVGYKRINKRTGKEIDRDNIVKGIKQDNGEYVILSDEEIKAAYPKSTQSIDIDVFVKAVEIPFTLLDTPYYLEPLAKGEKVYALLREAMKAEGVIGVARIVMHNKEHLAALIPDGNALLLNTIRWANELRPRSALKLPASGKTGPGLKSAELNMASRLIANMTGPWKPESYRDTFTAAIHKLAAQRARAGKTKQVTPLEELPERPTGANVVDLTELLKQSLAQGRPRASGRSTADSAKSRSTKAKTSTTRKAQRRAA
jgi:DNA end-binding protein Ku